MNNVVPKDFSAAVKDIKLAILQARAKAAHLANAEALKLYFFVGGYISNVSFPFFSNRYSLPPPFFVDAPAFSPVF